jgi:hypothetical protein
MSTKCARLIGSAIIIMGGAIAIGLFDIATRSSAGAGLVVGVGCVGVGGLLFLVDYFRDDGPK